MDNDKIFTPRVYNKLKPNGSRAVLILLGFSGIQEFARHAGVNHETAGAILGTCVLKYHKQHYVLITVHEALHTAYMDKKNDLDRPARAFICLWAKRWQKESIRDRLFVESAGKIKEEISPVILKDRKRKRKKVLDSVLAAFKSLEWKP